MTYSKIKELKEEFINEAIGAPKLFNDLAKVEQYIAESYKTRALIELIQNADDANSSIFGIHSINGGFIVCNNGDLFTKDDIEALCRSGSSNKYRGGKTIGYRGIGFKSVVNLANRITILSGEYYFTFDRDRTRKLLKNNTDIPLIRVPHENYKTEFNSEVTEIIKSHKYTTIFIFQDLITNISKEELSGLDRSTLLFLNNIKRVIIDYQNIKRNIIVKQSILDQNITIQINEGDTNDFWEIYSGNLDKVNRVAFRKKDGIITSASLQESVIHSFTPTHEFSGAYIKINGDFSTDPSRKTIDMDEISESSFREAVLLISNSILSIINGDLTKRGFFIPFTNLQPSDSSRFRPLLFKSLEISLLGSSVRNDVGIYNSFKSLRIKPEWLNYEDYENLCHSEIQAIKKEITINYPELFSFLTSINVKILSLDEIISRINSSSISIIGRSAIFEKIIKQFRYDLSNEKIEIIKSLKLFPVGNEFVSNNEIMIASEIDLIFMKYLNENIDKPDLDMFFKKLGINSIIEQERPYTIKTDIPNPTSKNLGEKPSIFKTEPSIKKWRSTEQNAAEYLRALKDVLNVTDVTQANLGYDLEVILNSSKRIYIEVKSLSSYSEPFKISNNEYSSAHSYGKDYYLALVVNDESFSIKFIPDPIKSLSFEKKCERWSWYCDQYSFDLQNTIDLIL